MDACKEQERAYNSILGFLAAQRIALCCYLDEYEEGKAAAAMSDAVAPRFNICGIPPVSLLTEALQQRVPVY